MITRRPVRPGFPWVLTVMTFAMAAALTWRNLLLFRIFDDPSGCGECIMLAATLNDSPFLLAWFAVTWFGFSSPSRIISRLCRLISGLGFLVYAADVYIMGAFSTRLYFPWIVKIGATPEVVLDHLVSSGLSDIALFGVMIFLILATLATKPGQVRMHRPMILTLTVLFAISVVLSTRNQLDYVHAWAAENVFTTSQYSGLSRPYSESYLGAAQASIGNIPECRKGENTQRDVIVLILESWSAYHSGFWGGARDWTPSIDKIAPNSIHATRFIAGGFTTNQGLMSIVSGIPVISPLTSLFEWKAFDPSWGWQHTLPAQLDSGGYHTAFLTSGNLGFSGKGKWLEHTGFGYTEGSDYPGYEGHPRSLFNSVPDEVLFDRAVSYWQNHDHETGPLALVVESVSSHTPFKHPLTGEKGEEPVIRYMDGATGSFFEELSEAGFFSSGGVLLLVSDHRAMTVMNQHEVESFGAWASGLIPLLLFGDDLAPRATDRVYHQSDIAPSLAGYFTGRGCGFPGWRSLFEEPENVENRCVFHASGSDWEKLNVYCDRGHGVIALNGDDSKFLESHNLSKQLQDHALGQVAYFRTTSHETSRRFQENN